MWDKYNQRFETLIGNDVVSQYINGLKRNKTSALDQLRQVNQNAMIKHVINKKRKRESTPPKTEPTPEPDPTPKSDPTPKI